MKRYGRGRHGNSIMYYLMSTTTDNNTSTHDQQKSTRMEYNTALPFPSPLLSSPLPPFLNSLSSNQPTIHTLNPFHVSSLRPSSQLEYLTVSLNYTAQHSTANVLVSKSPEQANTTQHSTLPHLNRQSTNYSTVYQHI